MGQAAAKKIEPSTQGKLVEKRTNRVVRIPLVMFPKAENPDDDVWLVLWRAALQAANYGNLRLSESYAKKKAEENGVEIPGWSGYRDFNEKLSASVRDAVDRECQGIWRRLGKKIFRGEQTIGRFQAGRALVVRGRSIKLLRTKSKDDKPTFALQLRILPRKISGLHEFEVYAPALQRDPYLKGLLDKLCAKADGHEITKASIVFERPGRKVFILLSYSKPAIESDPDKTTCGVEWRMDRGLFLRCNGREISLNDRITRMVTMKKNFSGIHKRLKHDLAKARRMHEYRKALVKAGNFDTWVQGPLHELTRRIVDWAKQQGAGNVEWRVAIPADVPLNERAPWSRIQAEVAYKSEEAGLSFKVIKPPKEEKSSN